MTRRARRAPAASAETPLGSHAEEGEGSGKGAEPAEETAAEVKADAGTTDTADGKVLKEF